MASVFITGAGRRIGRHLAYGFAERGWDVAVHYGTSADGARQTADDLRQRYGVRACTVRADVRSADEVVRALRTAREELGPLNVLVNNAGVFPSRRPLREIDEEFWDTVLDTNLRSQLTVSREFLNVCSDGSARIVNFASLGGLEVWKERLAYNVSKAGVIRLTQALARELAPGIAVNCVAPGVIDLPEEPSEPVGIPALRIPMQRYGTADDVFDAVYFFATCSPFITGQTLVVDGGQHLA